MAVERAIRKLEESKLIITRAAIGIIVGLSVSSLVHYPRVKSLLNRYTNLHQKFLRASTQSEEELIEQVKAAIQQLQAANRPVTQIAIGAIVSKHPAILKRYPKVNALFKQINNKNRQARSAQSERREDQLVVKVESAIRQLEDSNLPITQTAISKIVGMPETAMYYYPDVISLLKKTVKEKKHQQAMEEARLREKALIERVLMAEAQLRSLGKSVSKTAISKIIHVSQSTFNNYPSAKAILQQIVANKS